MYNNYYKPCIIEKHYKNSIFIQEAKLWIKK